MSKQKEKFKVDVTDAIALTEKYDWNFTGFQVHDQTLTFSWNGKTKMDFSLCISEEYPENSLLTRIGEEKADIVHRPVTTVIQKLHSELSNSTDLEKDMRLLCKPTVNRLISRESDQSEYVECLSGDTDEYDMEDYYQEHNTMDDDSGGIHPLLQSDIDLLKLIYGDKAVTFRLLDSINEIDVDLHIPVSFLEKEVTSAWKIKRDEPLIVRLHLSSYDYLDYQAHPKVEVLQPSQKEKFSIGIQMAKIMEMFLLDQWKKLSNDILDTAVSRSISVPAGLCHLATDYQHNNNNRDPNPEELFNVDDASLCQLIDMGFSVDLARNSLIITRGNVQEALEFLVTNPEGANETSEKSKKSSKPNAPDRQKSNPNTFKRYAYNKKLAKRQKSLTTSSTTPNLASSAAIEDLTLLPSSTIKGLNSKNIPSLENGFLVQVFCFARQRIPTLNEYCIICDEPHVFQNGAMLKPAVCSRELCVFSFQTLHVMSDAAVDIATGAEVVDLLITMTKAASKHNRRNIIFDPYPTIVDPRRPTELALNPKGKDYGQVEEILKQIPDMSCINLYSNVELKQSLDQKNFLAYPLLTWIIASNRSHIVKLSPDKIIASMATPHQFLLRSSPPSKEAIFREEKKKHGSTFAFHGSSIENWHSIIREGLIVASGTNKQLNGAAHGKGIYLSPSSSVSFGYSRMGYGAYNTKKGSKIEKKGTRFLTSDNITCIAICEVITSPQLKKSGDIWVAPQSDHVCTRFFFVYEDGQVGDNQINLQVAKYRQEIDRAMGQ